MKEGDYVRLPDGIHKIKHYEYRPDYENCHCMYLDDNDYGLLFTNKDLIKSSPNIIDLIEEKDLITIEYYSLRYEERVTRLFEVYYKDNKFMNLGNAKCEFLLVNGNFNNKDKQLEPIIKSIVTKEQFESMEYKIGE